MPKLSQQYECTAFESDGKDLIVYTDEGDEVPIRVERYRLRSLINAAIAALTGEKGTW